MHESEDEIVFYLPNSYVSTVEVIKNCEDRTKCYSKVSGILHILCVFYALCPLFFTISIKFSEYQIW